MKSRGFTLIELLAVVVILAIIAVIVTPVVIQLLDKGASDAGRVQYENIIAATQTWAVDHMDELPSVTGGTKDVLFTELTTLGYLKKDLKNPETDANYSTDYKVVITLDGNEYTYKIYRGTILEYPK